MELKFIDYNAAKDRRSRKAIRSHVMKGKNAGKKVQRGRKHAPDNGFFRDVKVREKDPETDPSDSQLIFPEIAEMGKPPIPSNHFIGTEFAYFEFPIQFTSSMRYMVHQCSLPLPTFNAANLRSSPGYLRCPISYSILSPIHRRQSTLVSIHDIRSSL